MKLIDNTQLAKDILSNGAFLTLDNVSELKGKTIQCAYQGDEANGLVVLEFTVGEITPGSRHDFDLYDNNGEKTHIFTCYGEKIFFCSDADRAVKFIEK